MIQEQSHKREQALDEMMLVSRLIAGRIRPGDVDRLCKILIRRAEGFARLHPVSDYDPEDVAAELVETFYKEIVATHLHKKSSLSSPEHFWYLFYKFCKQRIQNIVERVKRERRLNTINLDQVGEWEIPRDQAPFPGEIVENKPCLATLVAAAHRLSKVEGEVLWLYYVGGLQYQEIARHLSIPLNTVRTRLRRARLRFSRVYAELLREENNQ